MSAVASQIISVSILYSAVCSGAGQRKHQSSYHWLCKGNSPVKGSVTRKVFPFDNVIVELCKVTTQRIKFESLRFNYLSRLNNFNFVLTWTVLKNATQKSEPNHAYICWCVLYGKVRWDEIVQSDVDQPFISIILLQLDCLLFRERHPRSIWPASSCSRER